MFIYYWLPHLIIFSLQQALTSLQQRQLDTLSTWLDHMEAEMSVFITSSPGHEALDLGDLEDQMDKHKVSVTWVLLPAHH